MAHASSFLSNLCATATPVIMVRHDRVQNREKKSRERRILLMEFILKTYSPANQIARNKHNDEELELLKSWTDNISFIISLLFFLRHSLVYTYGWYSSNNINLGLKIGIVRLKIDLALN